MSDKKQTAVEFLGLSLLGLISFDSEELRTKYKERIAKAKELEKEQIKNSWESGYERGYGFLSSEIDSAEQYYTEIYDN
jgi:hypothetical protein